MTFPYLLLFGILLLVYLGYSFWQRLDPRYPVGAALVLLEVTAFTEAFGASPQADTLAEFVFLLLVGGAILILLDRFRARRELLPDGSSSDRRARVAEEEPTDPTDQRKGPSEEPLDHLEQQSVPPVDAPGGHHDEDEQTRHA